MITIGIDTLNEAKADLDDSFIMEKDVEALRRVIDALPSGYKIIFNLYVVEGYKHKEIAQLLGISVNTSKSQLIHAKKYKKTTWVNESGDRSFKNGRS